MDLLAQTSCNHIIGSPLVAYTSATCPRCFGTNTYGGLSLSSTGLLQTVSGADQLNQQIAKILTEALRPSGYGFDYSVFTNVIDPTTLDNLRNAVYQSLLYLQTIQQQAVQSGASYRADEQIQKIVSVSANTLNGDISSRTVSVWATVQTRSHTSVTTVVTIQR